MDKSKIRPLKTQSLKSRPATAHSLAWSCDAELAVATEDTIHIFLPQYPKPRAGEEGEKEDGQHQFSLSFRCSGIMRPDPLINGQLCAAAGVRIAAPRIGEDTSFKGVGNGLVTGLGASVNQLIRLEWSPSGVGCNLRPVLTALSSNGCVVALGEHIDRQSTMISGMRTRGFKSWKVLWGLGASLPLPDADLEDGYRNVDERIKSFSWAKEILNGRALLAYMNDSEEVVIMAVQFLSRARSLRTPSEEESVWDIREMARFDGRGRHTKEDATDITDPDFVPSGSAFALKWSPWHVRGGVKTAMLAYLAKNHVGFRRVTIQGGWMNGELPDMRVEECDTTSICMPLATDAFVDFENETYMEHDKPVVRGVIGTPFTVKPFKVSFAEEPQSVPEAHYTWECSTTYPQDDEVSANPITGKGDANHEHDCVHNILFFINNVLGLVVHQRDSASQAAVPRYSLVRLSATATNQDWYQTNVPEEISELPQWVRRIKNQTNRVVTRVAALEGLDTDSDDSEDDMMAMMMMMEDDGDSSKLRVHPYRYRIWGMAASPGDGTTAALVSRTGTQHPDRRSRVKLVFGWREGTDGNEAALRVNKSRSRKLTTEGQLWEWMYANGPEVPGATVRMDNIITDYHGSALRTQFREVLPKQCCVFCDAPLSSEHDEAQCTNGHSFAVCAATGLAIMAPDISRMCAVCELRCLKVSELARMAEEHLGPGTAVESSGEACGGCGGKFVA